MRRRLLIVAIVAPFVIGGGLAAAWAAGLILHDSAKPASVPAAVRRFRLLDPKPAALDGVYLYATRGGESLDALGGAHHRYPARTSITLIKTGCGGAQLRWDGLQGRSTTWTLCQTRTGVELRTSDEIHRFFGQTDRTTYTCTGSLVRLTSPDSRPFQCRSDHGRELGTARLVGGEYTVQIGSAGVRAIHVRTTAQVSGGDSGTETVDWWLAADSPLPLRLVLGSRTSRKVFVGRVHYREQVVLQLLSVTPRR